MGFANKKKSKLGGLALSAAVNSPGGVGGNVSKMETVSMERWRLSACG